LYRRSSLISVLLWLAPALAQPNLQIVQTALHQFDGGPVMPKPATYQPTELLFFTGKVAGYKKGPKEAVSLEWEAQAFDDKGVALAPSKKQPIQAELSEEDKNWLPVIRLDMELPQTASCRNCLLKLQVRDLVAGTSAKAEVPFAIQGLEVQPSDELVVRNFRFQRAETDQNPLKDPAYRPGDEIWGRFEITGFKYGEKNLVQVEYGVSVFRPSGKLLYQEPKAATANESSFYPRRYLPGVLSMKLDSKVPPGEYPLVLEVRDLIGNQKTEMRFTFRVE
jgi:hypothetical protein